MSQQSYELDSFVEGCAKGVEAAFVTKGAMESAKSDFNLTTQDRVLKFIGNQGLENPYFINSRLWKNNPDASSRIQVDAWGFFSGMLHGYIAFFFQPLTKKWTIKSLKKNTAGDPRNLAMHSGLMNFLDKQKGEGS